MNFVILGCVFLHFVFAQCPCPNVFAPGDDEHASYLVELEDFHPELIDCVHFFNETTICFSTEWPRNYDYRGLGIRKIEQNRMVEAGGMCRSTEDTMWHLHDVTHEKANRDYTKNEWCGPKNPPPTTVYIVDSYLDVNHPAFGDRARLGIKILEGTGNLHGTHVAGLVGGSPTGVNINARLVSVQVLNDGGVGTWTEVLKGLEWISKQKEKGIINISISGERTDMVNDVMRRMSRRGWKIVVAAGNESKDACLNSPGSAKDVITVGAYARGAAWASFSNFGRCVDLLAPGDAVMSTLPGNNYGYMSGTSMASPIVAGVWSLFPEWDADALKKASVRRDLRGLPGKTTNQVAFNLGVDALFPHKALVTNEWWKPILLSQ